MMYTRLILLVLFLTFFSEEKLRARDAFVVLSGGVSPFENNYSQYLQAKAVGAFFEQNYPADSVWIFFGAGNVEGKKPVFGDVRRQIQQDGLTIESWIAGSLRHNRSARRDVVLRAFREEILPAIADGGTLYLFVGDHGSKTRGKNGESTIELWSLERDPRSERGWSSSTSETLTVTDLRRTLSGGIGKGRVVFCMTQCHAGGFHYLAVPRDMAPNPKWFTLVPAWAKPAEQLNFPRAAGFTATDESSPAAGCVADPSPNNWAGYERFVPENMLGLDLFTLKPSGKAARSFADAHVAAILVDDTIDKPYSTSEQYLERWANLIETRLIREPNLTRTVQKQVAAYSRAVDGVAQRISDPAFRERQALFRRFTEKLCEQNPATKTLLLTGIRRELEMEITNRPARIPERETIQGNDGPAAPTQRRRRGSGASSESRKLWSETVRPAWKIAVQANQVHNVPATALEFEKHLLGLEDGGSNYFFGAGSALRQEVFWQSGYSDPQSVDSAKAQAIARWGATRRTEIVAWAKASSDLNVRAAAEKLSPIRPRTQSSPPALGQLTFKLSKRTAAERVLFYRRVLAAWQFLLALNERPALVRLHELIELERTPLPRPNKRQ